VHLTRFTDYALRVLTFLGLRGEEGARIREIAERFGISENHLMKVVQELGKHGFVRTIRGRGGGLRLARPPEAIQLGAVVRAVEGDLAIVECLGPGGSSCAIVGACRLTGILGDALDAFLDVLDRYTLADLLGPAARLRALLDLPAPESHSRPDGRAAPVASSAAPSR
jgi:Rrf2 family nitric oxide-sensitive transcriptional repressor